jgi:hypothetical protein
MGGEEDRAALVLPSQIGVPSFRGFHRHSIAAGDPLGAYKAAQMDHFRVRCSNASLSHSASSQWEPFRL